MENEIIDAVVTPVTEVVEESTQAIQPVVEAAKTIEIPVESIKNSGFTRKETLAVSGVALAGAGFALGLEHLIPKVVKAVKNVVNSFNKKEEKPEESATPQPEVTVENPAPKQE